MTTTLTVEEDGSVTNRYNVSGTGLDFTISMTDTRIDITGNSHMVEVAMDNTYKTRANIKWIAQAGPTAPLGYRTDEPGHVQGTSLTYVPAPSSGTAVDDPTDFLSGLAALYPLANTSYWKIGNVITQNQGEDDIYSYVIYRPVKDVSEVIARRTRYQNIADAMVMTTTEVTITELLSPGSRNTFIYKKSDDNDLLYIIDVPNLRRYVVDFDAEDYDAYDITLAGTDYYQTGKYLNGFVRTVVGTSDYIIYYTYDKVDISTGYVHQTSIGEIIMTGYTAANHTVICSARSARVDGGLMFMEWYRTGITGNNGELGMIYGTELGVNRDIEWKNPGGWALQIYSYGNIGPNAGFVGNDKDGLTYLLGSLSYYLTKSGETPVEKSVVSSVNDSMVPVYTRYDAYWPSYPDQPTLSSTPSYAAVSSNYLEGAYAPYFFEIRYGSLTSVKLRSGIYGTTVLTITAADLGYYRICAIEGSTADDVDDTIYMAGQLENGGSWIPIGIDLTGALTKEIDVGVYSPTLSTQIYTSNGFFVHRCDYVVGSDHYAITYITFMWPVDPNYEREF